MLPHRERTHRGQTLVEFAVILPLLLAMVGGAIDLARAFQASTTLQSAARNAAEHVAASTTDATAEGVRIVCTETQYLAGFEGTANACTQPSVTVTWNSDPAAPGGTAQYPVGTSTVTAELDFSMLFPWPMLPSGTWTLRADATFTMVQGR